MVTLIDDNYQHLLYNPSANEYLDSLMPEIKQEASEEDYWSQLADEVCGANKQ
jgi:hypothetical protein